MVHITVLYTGELHCRATHGPSSATLETDAPVDNHGRGESFSPTDLVATALATCMATIMGIAARTHGIDLAGMEINISKEMSQDAPRRIVGLPSRVTIPLAPEHPKRPLLEAAALGCPVRHSLAEGVAKPVEFIWAGNVS